jgi:hypothetical protein
MASAHYKLGQLSELKNRFDYDSVYGRRCVMVYYGSGGFKT